MNDQIPGLKKKVISGFLWLGSLTFVGQAITWAITLIVIRLLKPEDYGLMAMATVYISFLTILNELGLGAAVIQRSKISEQDIKNLNGWVVIINLCLLIFVLLTAPVMARFFSEPRLIPIIRTLALNFILVSFYFLPESLVKRELKFRTNSIVNLISNLISSVIVLTSALAGLGVWALVFGSLGIHLTKLIAYNSMSTYRYRPSLSLKGMWQMFTFGGYISATRIIWYFYSQSDIIICGRIFGKELLGIYSVAMQLVSIPMSKISPLLSQIGFSAFSRIQEDHNAFQINFLRLVRLVATFSLPLFGGMAIIAPEAVPLVLGENWTNVVLPIQLLSLIMPFRFIAALFGPIVSASGRPGVILGNMVIAVIIMPSAFFIGSNWGIIGLCYAWVTIYPVLFLLMTMRVFNTLRLPLIAFWNIIWLPLFASGVMGLGLLAFKWVIRMSPELSLPISILLGVFLYSTMVLIINRNVLVEIRSFLSTKA